MKIPVGMNIPVRSEQEQIQFYETCKTCFREAELNTTGEKFYCEIAGTVVCLNFAGDQLISYLTPALEHLQVPEKSNPDCIINVWDSESTGVNMAPPPCEPTHFTDRGDIWGFNSRRIKTAFHWSEYSVNVMDLQTNEAVYWVKSVNHLPYWATSAPFRTIFHWWMEKNDCQLLHAAAVGTENGAVLITGKGGVGKSTTALTSLHEGLDYLADDYLIVKKDPHPEVFSLYSTGKLNRGELDRFPRFKNLAARHLVENQEKDVIYLYPVFEKQIKKSAKLRSILVPELSQRDKTEFKSISFWRMIRAMSFTTLSQLPGAGPHTQKYLHDLCRKVPIYKIEPGCDLKEVAGSVKQFLKQPQKFERNNNIQVSSEEYPLVSVILPVYNGEEFIKVAAENIFSQQYPALELIIVDDGSTDNTSKIVENLPFDIRYFRQANAGPSVARNKGIKDASGKYLAFLDVDDLWPENNLNALVEELEKHDDMDVVRGYSQLFKSNEDGSIEYLGNPEESYRYYIGAALYRKEVFSKVGLFDWSLTFGEDTDWYNRAKELRINIKWLDEVTLFVRRHGGNMTEGKNIIELNRLKTFKKILDRDRQREQHQRLLKKERK